MQMLPPPMLPEPILTPEQVAMLRSVLGGRSCVLSFGAGVDSTALLVLLRAAGIVPDVILFADVGNEKKRTYEHLAKIQAVLASWGWPPVIVVRYRPGPKTGYSDLFGNCVENVTLPSFAYGKKGCSDKWKLKVLDRHLKGCTRGPNKSAPHPLYSQSLATGVPIIRLIGYDHGRADIDRAGRINVDNEEFFEYSYPLQLLGWVRRDCINAIVKMLGVGMVPIKSACFFCPGSKEWELFDLAGVSPEQLDDALYLERVGMTGKNSRYDAHAMGGTWEELIRAPKMVRSKTFTVGLGRSFAWNQWARLNNVLDEEGRVRRTPADRARFLQRAAELRNGDDNALDARCDLDAPPTPRIRRVIRIAEQQTLELGQLPVLNKPAQPRPAPKPRQRRKAA